MEIQVDFFGIDVARRLVLIWYLFSQDGICSGSKSFILKVGPTCTHTFWTVSTFLQKHNMHTLVVFSIAKELVTCRLGGVMSTQKVLF